MGKFEKKRNASASARQRITRNDPEYDGYSLEGMRDLHEGRAVYHEPQGPTVRSSSVRRSDRNDRQQAPYYDGDPYAQPEPRYGEPAPRAGRRDRRRPSADVPDPYADPDLYAAPDPRDTRPRSGGSVRKKPKKGRKKHRFLRFLLHIPLILLVLVILAVLLSVLLAKMPETDQPIGARKDGCCTVLLCGTDAEGARTDTMLLLYLDRSHKQTRLLSLPRDTMVNRDNPVPKLNGAYYANGAGEKGMGFLMDYVKDLVGFRPDAYVLLDLDCFAELVDSMGGVKFDVPMDMYYNDPTQDLYIDLKAGEQTLNGQEAMWLVRFRSGYAMADLERVRVQRDFLQSAIGQWKSLLKLPRVPHTASLLLENTQTDLDYRNLCWLALALVKSEGGFDSDTLPGEPAWVNGGAYYVEDREAAAALVNEKYNPYETQIRAEDLHPYGK